MIFIELIVTKQNVNWRKILWMKILHVVDKKDFFCSKNRPIFLGFNNDFIKFLRFVTNTGLMFIVNIKKTYQICFLSRLGMWIFCCCMYSSLDKKSQIVGWLVTHGGKWCVYAKRMFCQHFRIVEKKLAEGSAYLVYNRIYNGKNLKKPKILILGTKTHLYELICHPHIEEDQT